MESSAVLVITGTAITMGRPILRQVLVLSFRTTLTGIHTSIRNTEDDKGDLYDGVNYYEYNHPITTVGEVSGEAWNPYGRQ